jgi:pimeloyl-ACP methyl ester carboxylesterase
MPIAATRDIFLEYDTLGSCSGEPLLIIQGLADQMTKWSDGFHKGLVARGFFVIRFDNRDVGLSSHLNHLPPPDLAAVLGALAQGSVPAIPYCLEDMAADAAAVLAAVGVRRAHILGASMGGMIAQLFAASYPERTLSLISIMSSTGNPDLPPAKPEAMGALMAPAPDPSDLEAYLAHAVNSANALGSPSYPEDEVVLKSNLTAFVQRSYDPAGVRRQIAAVLAGSDRRDRLGRVKSPALIIHGADDPLGPVEAGRDTAAAIPAAELKIIAGMGHNLPRALYDVVADAVADFVRRKAASNPGARP